MPELNAAAQGQILAGVAGLESMLPKCPGGQQERDVSTGRYSGAVRVQLLGSGPAAGGLFSGDPGAVLKANRWELPVPARHPCAPGRR